MKNSASRITTGLFIFGIIAIAGFFRFYQIDKMVHWVDESMTSYFLSGYKWSEVKHALSGRELGVADVLKYQRISSKKDVTDTVRALADFSPVHPPLYYASARLWAGIFGGSIASLRGFSALISMISLLLVYWLTMELFGSRRIAWCAVLLIAVSPFHVLYAKEARQYTLLLAVTLLSSAVLLRALRLNSRKIWFIYTISTASGLYTHLFFANVIAAHWIYVFTIKCSQRPRIVKPFFKSLMPFIMSSLVGIIVFAPWAWIIFKKISQVLAPTSWLLQPVPLLLLIGRWGYNYSVIFLDTDHALNFLEQVNAGVAMSYLFQCLILILEGYSIYFLYSKAPKRSALFIIFLIAIPFFTLALPDLFLGTGVSWVYRFLSPSYLGIHIAIAYLLVTRMQFGFRKFWRTITVFLVLCGIFSCILVLQAESWWYKTTEYYTPEAARKVNEAAQPLLITHFSIFLFPICHELDSKVRVLTVTKAEDIQISDKYSDIFVYRPTLWLKQAFKDKYGNKFIQIYPRGRLWHLERT